MNFDIDDIESKMLDLSKNSPEEAFKIFKRDIVNETDVNNLTVRIHHQKRFFSIQVGKEKITFYDTREFNYDDFKKLSEDIISFCSKNNINIA